MNILVTGGRGYLGGRIAKQFLALGHNLTITTRSSFPENLSGSRIEYVNPDWSSVPDLLRLCEDKDLIIHAAGVNSETCLKDPELAHEFNGKATGRLAEASVKSGVGNFIYLSTAHVYANPLIGHLDEDSPTINPHPYATSHLLGEANVLNTNYKSNMRTCIIRISNVYGSPETPETDCWKLLINDVCRQVAEKSIIRLQSDGSHERNFVPMTDFLDFIVAISNQLTEREVPNVINFGSTNSNTVLEMASRIRALTPKVFGYLPDIEMKQSDTIQETRHLTYSTKFEALVEKFRINNIDQEIYQLLQFCKNSFDKDS